MNYDVKPKFTIKQILKDWWSTLLSQNISIRPVVKEEVEKVIRCGDFSYGFHLFYCFVCCVFKNVPFTCKSRFCNSCGSKYSKERVEAVTNKLLNCPHRHVVFTIPAELRPYFRNNRLLLNILFDAVSITLSSWFKSQNKSQSFTPGFVCTLHTFGRDLKWNPHIHVLLTDGASGNFTVWKPFKHLPYTMLRKRWRSVLLSLLSKNIFYPDFKKLVSFFYREYKDGFYVYAPPNKFKDVKKAVEYVLRYLGRPVMAQSRISNYDGSLVTFWYQRHEDNQLVTVSIHALEFIKLLIIHIPDRQFKMVRYYGLYAKKHINDSKLFKLISKKLKSFKNKNNTWRHRILLDFNYDPLKCSCGAYFKHIQSFFGDKYKSVAFYPT